MHPPRLPDDVIARPRLVERIDQGVGFPLLLVVAPAGFGKTTLLTSWAAASDRPIAWLTVSATENGRTAFGHALLAAVDSTVPGFSTALHSLLELREAPSTAYMAEAIADELARFENRTVLVADQYEHVRSDEVHELVVGLVQCAGPGFSVVLASRLEPPFPLSLLRSRGQVGELGPEALRFDRQEGAQFVRASSGQLDEGVIYDMVDRTSGWPAALRLTAGLSAGRGADAFSRPGAWDEAAMHRILIDEVLLEQEPSVRRFMLETAIPDRFCLPLRDALAGDLIAPGESQRALEQVLRAGLLVAPMDPDGVWYEYHSLLLEALRAHLLATSGAAAVAELHRRAAIWLSEQGLFPEAVGHAITSADEQLTVDVIQVSVPALLAGEQVAILESLLEKVPNGLVNRRVPLLLARAWVLTVRLGFETIEQILGQIERLSAGDRDSAAGQQAQLTCLRAVVAFAHNDLERARDLAWDAMEAEGPFLHARRVVTTVWGLSSYGLGEEQTAIAHFSNEANLVPAGFDEDARRIAVLNSLAGMCLLKGDLDAVDRWASMAVTRARNRDLRIAESWARYLLALRHLLRNELAEAAEHFNSALQGGSRTNGLVLRESYLGLALCQEVLGASEMARTTLAAARRLEGRDTGIRPE